MTTDGHTLYSAVIADRYHPVGEQVMPHIANSAVGELDNKAEIAAKWAGVSPVSDA